MIQQQTERQRYIHEMKDLAKWVHTTWGVSRVPKDYRVAVMSHAQHLAKVTVANTNIQCAFEIKLNSQAEHDFIVLLGRRASGILNPKDEIDPSTLAPFEKAVYDADEWGWDISVRTTSAHFSFDGGASIEAMVLGLQEFLTKFHPDAVIKFSWAFTCDKLRPDAFSGGGVAFNAQKAVWLDVDNELARAADKLLEDR